MKKTINIQNEANIKAEGKFDSKRCKPVICIETGEVFSSMTDAADKAGLVASNLSSHLAGKLRTFGGKHYCYLSRVNESLDAIVTRLRETSSLEEDAKRWQAYQAEQEAIRQEEERIRRKEEERIEAERKAREELLAKIEKATAKVARRAVVRDNKAAEMRMAEERLMEAERELEALQDMLGE